jgi:hypothetical protein
MVDRAREWGTDLIFHNIWENLGLPATLERLLAKTDITTPISEAIYAMVLNRISDPLSKRAVSEWASDIYHPSFAVLQLHHFYRALDFLIENQYFIEQDLFEKTKNLFNLDLDMVFWDTTSTYFEGEGPEGLAEYGYSKDHRPDRVQVVVGILMTPGGHPGSTSDLSWQYCRY